MKTRELSVGEKLRADGKSIGAIVQTLTLASTTIWKVLKKKGATDVEPVDQGQHQQLMTGSL